MPLNIILFNAHPLSITRLYQHQLDMEKAEQLKKPTEDLEVRESSALPALPSLGWIRLPADAFSNLLMVVEFSHSFEEFLELEPSPPLLSEVYLAIYNGGGGKVVMELCTQLLKAAIYDPSKCEGYIRTYVVKYGLLELCNYALTAVKNFCVLIFVHVAKTTFCNCLRSMRKHCSQSKGMVEDTYLHTYVPTYAIYIAILAIN